MCLKFCLKLFLIGEGVSFFLSLSRERETIILVHASSEKMSLNISFERKLIIQQYVTKITNERKGGKIMVI